MRSLQPANFILLVALLSLVQGCVSLSNLNLFSQQQSSNQSTVNGQANPNGARALSEQEQAKRALLLAGKSARPTLQSLNLAPLSLQDKTIPVLTLQQKRDEYAQLLPLISDPIQKQQAAFRLADINMLLAEQAQEQGRTLQAANESFTDAIANYKVVLQQYEVVSPIHGVALSEEQQALNRKQMDAMYQLTRALDLSAQPEQSMQVAKAFLSKFSIEQFTLTPYHVELFFRVGEYYFARQQYANAGEYYAKVLKYGGANALQGATNFYPISAYMLGWSYFKLDEYPQAMRGFAALLDASLLNNISITDIALQQQSLSELPLRKGDLRLVKDAVRVMALTFSYQGNGNAINGFFAEYGARAYQQIIVDELAQQHLDNSRFVDSAAVLVNFAQQYPVHPRAVEFYIRHIDAFVLGGFPSEVLVAKEEFVSAYSLGKGIIANKDTPIGRDALPYLRTYIKELAQTEHSIAQSIDMVLAQREAQNGGVQQTQQNSIGFSAQGMANMQSSAWATASISQLQSLSQQAYTKAKGYYKNYIRTFTPSATVVPLRFYLAEAHVALHEYEQAIETFENYAYFDSVNAFDNSTLAIQNIDTPEPVEAAYAALLVHQTMAKQAESPVTNINDSRSIMPFEAPLNIRQLAQAKFAKSFMSDSRSPQVALTLMQDLFAQQNYIPAQDWARWLLQQPDGGQDDIAAATIGDNIINSSTTGNTPRSPISLSIQESAKLVIAHSYFAMQAFGKAELSYRDLLVTLAPNDDRRANINDRLAASLYKQAEGLLLANGVDTATLQQQNINNKNQLMPAQIRALEKGVALLQQVVTQTPLSEFRQAAQYDSAVYFSLLENWPNAITTFLDFQARYPQSSLTPGISSQLFYAYEQSQDFAQAAVILLAKHDESPNSETGRLALLQAAEYFEKAEDRNNALDSFRRYAHKYPQPMSDANEVRFTLSEFYLQSNEAGKRRFWLNKLVQAHQSAMQQQPSLGTPRSVYLASFAAMVFATDANTVYTRIKLTQPLATSLQNKQTALQNAIDQYERIIGFGSAQFVTAANYELANLYIVLAQDLMNSSRPNGLSPLELSQYEILLEEQAYPFEETAIGLHEKNIARTRSGLYDEWVKQSFTALKNTMPGRYNKPEVTREVTLDDL